MGLCESTGCDKPSTRVEGVANLCQHHWMLWRRYGYVGSRFPTRCTVDGCEARHLSGGYCSRHYKLMRETGSTEDRPRKNARKPCTVPGCEAWRVGHGLCRLHYERQRALGRPPVLYPGRTCAWCEGDIPETRPADAIFCSTKCKQYSSNEKQRQNPEARERQRAANLMKKFGMTVAEYDALLEAQQSACAICRSSEPRGRGRFHVDHDHNTGTVRGLLCNECNAGLGKFKDDPQLLEAAMTYLARPIDFVP